MNNISYRPIGIVHSEYKKPEGTPIQPVASIGSEAVIEILPEFAEGLTDLEQFSHIWVLFHMHQARYKQLKVVPFLDSVSHGIFATRSPGRPNPIGISVVILNRIEGNRLYVKNIDIIDGSPVIDIKPFIAQFDVYENTNSGWFEGKAHKLENIKDDGRFTQNIQAND
ncbi:MAG: tRNA (N6-threonylcarbamoyladenosine(37)-N6)-methyltransferase TrmO [Bacteroidales bacterium]|nr:tRNA (N6-threonylcarbamoyladenosine(37)-N6)-methyltransferase TrmO [Bacteroidales bacterium]